jgi:hypothetical protein
MTPQPRTRKPKKQPATLDDLIESVQHLTKTMEQVIRTVQLLARENQRLIDVLIEDAGVVDDDGDPQTYMDGTRIS